MTRTLRVEISRGTAERLTRLYRESTGDYSPDGINSDGFDSWFNKWLNMELATKASREREVSEQYEYDRKRGVTK